MKVVWTRQAFARLAEIEDYIALDSATAAVAHTEKLIARAEALAAFPEMGRSVPELQGSGLRELIEGSYRIVYRIHRRRIEVLTVFEGHHLLPVEDLQEEG
ncbi:MAG TPA: type II toxin-antitoxin system RelE/ParE family toxin [bacterium]